ncbi:hypothetical protein DV738_g1317, partial [Chaetothyriales sp. CBS 135597]
MISSAVAIPDQPPAELSPPPASPLKRRPSLTSDAHATKRQRLDSSHATRNPRLDLSHSADSPLLDYGPADEKKRGQRLFGALLGTLSQTTNSSKPASAATRRREDIEKRQIDRLRAQQEERAEERRRRTAALAEKRKEEQKRWDHECRQLRWANMRSMASFLRTTAEPRLYYRPWELREEEKAQIERQQEEIERQIEREMAENNGESSLADVKTDESRGGVRESDASIEDRPVETTAATANQAPKATAEDRHDGPEAKPEAKPDETRDDRVQEEEERDEPDEPDKPEQSEQPTQDENQGEELVQGEEDDSDKREESLSSWKVFSLPNQAGAGQCMAVIVINIKADAGELCWSSDPSHQQVSDCTHCGSMGDLQRASAHPSGKTLFLALGGLGASNPLLGVVGERSAPQIEGASVERERRVLTSVGAGERVTMSATSASGKKKPTSAAVNLVAGGGAGMMEALVCHPLDTIKVRMQLSRRKTGPGQKPRGFIQTGRDIVKKETVFGLYKGLGAVLTGIVPKMAIRFTSYEWYKQSLSDDQGNITPGRTFIAGLAAGVTEAVAVVTPMEVVKIRMQAQYHSLSDPLDVPKYRSAPHALITVVREEGIGALYRGVSLTALRQGTNQAANFTAYSELKTLLQKLQPQYEGGQLPSWQTTIIGLISGAVGPFTNAPIDTIKTRLQKTPAQPGQTAIQRISLIARDMFRQEGPKAFYKGITPRVMRVAPGQAVTFTVYEFLKSNIENSRFFLGEGQYEDPLLQPKTPIYLLVRPRPVASALLTAIIYVPSTAPVRAKTLFASTRQSLTRSLGLDRFGDSVFVTDPHEVTDPAEWAARQRKRELQRVKRAEEVERHGTAGRQLSGRPQQLAGGGGSSSGLEVRATDEARAALRGLTGAGELVQLGLDLAKETLVLLLQARLSPDQVQAKVPTDRPSYNFYRHPEAVAEAEAEAGVLFIYVCPGVSKVKERMMYASSRNGVIETAKAEGVAIAKRLELDADDITADRLAEEAGVQLLEGLLARSGQGGGRFNR